MNGRELSERLQVLYPDLKCLFMSGYTADTIGHHGVLEDDIHFIQKPFSRRDLAKTVRKALDAP
jgi:two-component system sensor histidine kinase EvgS